MKIDYIFEKDIAILASISITFFGRDRLFFCFIFKATGKALNATPSSTHTLSKYHVNAHRKLALRAAYIRGLAAYIRGLAAYIRGLAASIVICELSLLCISVHQRQFCFSSPHSFSQGCKGASVLFASHCLSTREIFCRR